MEIVVDVGQGGVNTTVRGSDNAIDYNQFFHGNDCVNTLALDLVDRYHLFTTRYGLYTITYGYLARYDHGESLDNSSTGTSRKDVVGGHLEITSRFRGDDGEGGTVVVLAVG